MVTSAATLEATQRDTTAGRLAGYAGWSGRCLHRCEGGTEADTAVPTAGKKIMKTGGTGGDILEGRVEIGNQIFVPNLFGLWRGSGGTCGTRSLSEGGL